MRSARYSLALIGAFAILLAACTGGQQPTGGGGGASPTAAAGKPAYGGTITFAMPRAGRASASIQDLAGRRVRTVVEGELAAGIHQYAFDGRSDTGARLPAGVYFYSVSTPSGMITRRFTMLR